MAGDLPGGSVAAGVAELRPVLRSGEVERE
jgi:hypothetical protein